MLFEPKLGKLIRKLNPYTSGDMQTMVCGADPTDLATLGTDLTNLGNAISALANGSGTLQAVTDAEKKLDGDLPISDLDIRIDNDYQQEYMNWTFRGQPYKVKRALLIKYRYEIIRSGVGTGVFVTDHVLVGYAGGNGG
jgi:hypothetical protein